MRLFYTGLAFWCAAALLAAAAIGIGARRFEATSTQVHILVGLFASIFACLTHSVVFAHLIGSGITVKDAVSSHGLDPQIVRRTKKFKGRSFPFALFAALAAVAAALAGGAAYRAPDPGVTHAIVAAVAIVLSLVAFPIEVKVLHENTKLLREVDGLVRRAQASAAAGTGAPEPPATAERV